MCKTFLANHPTYGEGMIDLNTISLSKNGETVDFTLTKDPRGDRTPKTVSIKDFRDNLRGRSLEKFNEQIDSALREARTTRQRNRKNGQRKIGVEGVRPSMARKN